MDPTSVTTTGFRKAYANRDHAGLGPLRVREDHEPGAGEEGRDLGVVDEPVQDLNPVVPEQVAVRFRGSRHPRITSLVAGDSAQTSGIASRRYRSPLYRLIRPKKRTASSSATASPSPPSAKNA